MNQILLGMSIPFICATLLYIARKGRVTLTILIVTPVVMAVAALWAVIPDIPRLLGMRNLYYKLSADPRCDIFLWHYSIDSTETGSRLFLLGFAVILMLLLIAAWRELSLIEEKK